MMGLQAASQETYLSWSPIEQPGCADREENPSGDGVGCACAGLRRYAHDSGYAARAPSDAVIEASSSGAKSLNAQVFVYVAAALVPLSVSVAATDFSTDDLQSVVVTATRIPTPESQIASSVTVVTADEIAAR
jgi:hypothetical protein